MEVPTAVDVAAYIIKKQGAMPAMKLHKLVYYAQAWSLVWDDKPLFKDRIEAWINGPAIPRLYHLHRGEYEVTKRHFVRGDPTALSDKQRKTIDMVLRDYGGMTARELSELTHCEAPWKDAREGLSPMERGDREITRGSLYEYYDSLLNP
ncbi:MAG: Panacea domain-containing protein [Candidatus Tyrphobacter sp.]